MIKPRYLLLLLTTICMDVLSGQEVKLESYIKQGLESNLALQQLTDDYQKSLYSLKSARGLFFPDLGLDARFTVAKGGREIDFPVGDLLNPVYSTLNQLTQSEMFPQIENETFPFYRPKEQETKLSLIQPVFNPQIYYNYQIAKEQSEIERVDITIYQRELIKEIKSAYYNYQKTEYLILLVNETKELLKENIRVSRSLFENDKVTNDVVYRSEAELQNLLVQEAVAIKSKHASLSYFNFLLNRPLTDSIEIIEREWIISQPFQYQENSYEPGVTSSREELDQLKRYQEMNQKYMKLTQSANIPIVALAVNYGIQGEEYSFTADDDFMLASVVLRWNLFHGFKNRADVQRTRVAQHQLELKEQEVKQQLDLQAINAHNDLLAAIRAVDAAEAESKSLEKAFSVVEKKYRNGQSSLIEYIDARTAMTTSKQNLILAFFEVKIKEAEFERAIAAYQL